MTKNETMSNERAYGYFRNNSGEVGETYHTIYEATIKESVLDKKTHELVYIAYLAVIKEYSGLELHVKGLKKLGATRKEIESVIFCGIAPMGMSLIPAYQIAMKAYDEE